MMRRAFFIGVAAALVACGGEDPLPEQSMAASVEPTEQTTTAASASNSAPRIHSVDLDPRSPRPGEQVTAVVSATDPDGDAVEIDYRWTVGGETRPERGHTLHVEGEGRDTWIEVTVIARDGRDESAPETASARIGNMAPRVLQVILEPLGEVTAGRDVVASPSATDADGDPIDYAYRWLVNDEDVDADGATLTADQYERGDRIVLEVTANDGIEDSEPLRSAPIEVVNAAPRITSTPGAIGEDGVFRYTVTAEDPDGDRSFRFKLLKSPDGMTIDFNDGQLLWAPGPDLEGDHPVEVEVADRFGAKATQSFALRLAYATEGGEASTSPPASAEGDGS